MSSTLNNEDVKQLEEVSLDHPLVKAIITLNKEMGVVQGELKWIKILMVGTTVGVLGQLFFSLFS